MVSASTIPRVSCLCVTRNKPRKLQRAVDCFLAQRHANKELVLLYEDDDDATGSLVAELVARHDDLVVDARVAANPKLTLGELRNLSFERARGDYLCQWDDDDWYHNERITRQLEAAVASHRPACLLTNWIIYDEIERQAYFSFFRLWEGSLLCRKDALVDDLRYPAATRAEDTAFTELLRTRGLVYPLVAAGLYIYTAHGTNTWPREHFENNFRLSQKLAPETSRLVGDILEGRYAVDEASELLRSPDFLRPLSYFSSSINCR